MGPKKPVAVGTKSKRQKQADRSDSAKMGEHTRLKVAAAATHFVKKHAVLHDQLFGSPEPISPRSERLAARYCGGCKILLKDPAAAAAHMALCPCKKAESTMGKTPNEGAIVRLVIAL